MYIVLYTVYLEDCNYHYFHCRGDVVVMVVVVLVLVVVVVVVVIKVVEVVVMEA